MRSSALVRVGIMLLLSSSASAQGKLPRPTAGTGLHHVVNSFEFEIDAPLARAAPLFGPEGERKWAGKTWDPKFIYPTQPRDVEGAVFTVKQAGRNPLWINTVFDLADGRMQYVATTPGSMVTIVDVRLFPEGLKTRARVTYTRTALSPDTAAHIVLLGSADARSGPEWQAAIETALRTEASNGTEP
jgi:hypothetical protein